jgi:hypothetical protein
MATDWLIEPWVVP